MPSTPAFGPTPTAFDEAAVLARVREIFETARYMTSLGVVLDRVGPGVCVTSLTVRDDHLQQDGFVHAGVTAAIADHTAGGAAGTLAPEGHRVLTSEYSIHLLRPARGAQLRCLAKVLRPGRRLSVVESEVFTISGAGEEVLVAKLTATLALVAADELRR